MLSQLTRISTSTTATTEEGRGSGRVYATTDAALNPANFTYHFQGVAVHKSEYKVLPYDVLLTQSDLVASCFNRRRAVTKALYAAGYGDYVEVHQPTDLSEAEPF